MRVVLKKSACAVVDGMAPGVGGLELETVAEAAVQLGLQSMIRRCAPRGGNEVIGLKPRGIHVF